MNARPEIPVPAGRRLDCAGHLVSRPPRITAVGWFTILAVGCAAMVIPCALTGCNLQKAVEKVVPLDVQAVSRKAVADLKARRSWILQAQLVDELRVNDRTREFEKMADLVPDEEPKSVKIVGFSATVRAGQNTTRFDVAYEYEFSRKWLIAQFAWVRVNGLLRLQTLTVIPRNQSLAHENALTLKGKGLVNYVVLAACAFVLSLSVFAIVKCVRADNLRRKGVWILFIAFGFGTFTLNWTTGARSFELFNFQLLGVGANANFIGGPWMVAVSFPVGAVVFLLRHWRARPASLVSETVT
jgi:hypothetical protein